MLISSKRGYVFIAIPKTATSSLETLLQNIDSEVIWNKLPDEHDVWYNVGKHTTYLTAKKIMGHKTGNYKFIAAIRDPYSCIISKYFHYKSGHASKVTPKNIKKRITLKLKVLFAKLLPLSLWIFLYPYKSSHEFIVDENKKIAVDYFCVFENLQDDVLKIFKKFGYTEKDLSLPNKNRYHYNKGKYLNSWLIKSIIHIKSSKDIKIYKQIKNYNRKHLFK